MESKNVNYFLLYIAELKVFFLSFILVFIYHFLISYYYIDTLLFILISPIIKLNISKYFIITNLIELYYIQFGISFWIAFLTIIYLIFFLFIFFISSGLYYFENQYIFKYLIISFLLFIISNYLTLCYFLPLTSLSFFKDQNVNNFYLYNIYFEPQLYIYLKFILKLFIYNYFFFQLFLIYYIYFKNINNKIIFLFQELYYLLIFLFILFFFPLHIEYFYPFLILIIIFIFIMLFIYILKNNYKKYYFN